MTPKDTREDFRWDLYAAISERCFRNDEKWGGPAHDDTHSRRDWIAFIVRQLGHAEEHCDELAAHDYQDQMISICSLAIHAIESVDRIEEAKGVMPTEPSIRLNRAEGVSVTAPGSQPNGPGDRCEYGGNHSKSECECDPHGICTCNPYAEIGLSSIADRDPGCPVHGVRKAKPTGDWADALARSIAASRHSARVEKLPEDIAAALRKVARDCATLCSEYQNDGGEDTDRYSMGQGDAAGELEERIRAKYPVEEV